MRAGRVERRNEYAVGLCPARAAGLVRVVHWHCHHLPKAVRLRRTARVTLAEVHATGAPSPRHVGRTSEKNRQAARFCHAHQPPQQAPARAAGQAVVAQDDSAPRRQQRRQSDDTDPKPLVAEQPLRRQGVASDHRPFYRRVAGARNAPGWEE